MEKRHRVSHKENRATETKAWKMANREKVKSTSGAYRKAHRKQLREYDKNRQAKFPEISRAKCAKRKASKLSATPKWFEKEAIKDIYWGAEYLSRLTGVEWQVDHEIPLQNSIVCGLHVLSNLRYMLASDNAAKNNKFEAIFISTHNARLQSCTYQSQEAWSHRP